MEIYLNREKKFVDAVFEYVESGEILKPVEILRETEKRHNLLITYAFPEPYEEFWDDEWIEKSLKPFIDETDFIIAAGDFLLTKSFFNRKFQDFECSWRVWGHILAELLNSKLNIKDSEPNKISVKNSESNMWKYIDFYMETYIKDYFEDYSVWSKAINEILNKKDQIFADEIEYQASSVGKKITNISELKK